MLRATATDKNAVQDAAADEDENLKKKKKMQSRVHKCGLSTMLKSV